MGKAKYIYFQDKIANLLSTEENASALVNRLLIDYYSSLDKVKDISLEQEEINISKSIESLKLEAEKLEKKRLEMLDKINLSKEKQLLEQDMRYKDVALDKEISRLKMKYRQENPNTMKKDFTPKLLEQLKQQAINNLEVK